jgi:hypothetical protein
VVVPDGVEGKKDRGSLATTGLFDTQGWRDEELGPI